MPIYEYRCQTCGVKFEQLARFDSDLEKVPCPFCKSQTVERLVSAPAGRSSSGWDGFWYSGGG